MNSQFRQTDHSVYLPELANKRKEYNILNDYLQLGFKGLISSIILHGKPGSGKITLIKNVLTDLEVPIYIFCCHEIYDHKSLASLIYNTISRHYNFTPNEKNLKYHDLDTFSIQMKNLLKSIATDESLPLVIVMKCSELLLGLNSHFVDWMCNLGLYLNLNKNFCVILHSNASMSSYESLIHYRNVWNIHCNPLTSEQVTEMLRLYLRKNLPHEISAAKIDEFSKIFVDLSYITTNNVSELKTTALRCLNKVFSGSTEKLEKMLSVSVRNEIAQCWNDIFIDCSESIDFISDSSKDDGLKCITTNSLISWLIIAAFLSSKNPERLDKRLFAKSVRNESKLSKRAKVARKKSFLAGDTIPSVKSSKESGGKQEPKTGKISFSLERFLAIFFSITSTSANSYELVNDQIIRSISYLVSRGILACRNINGLMFSRNNATINSLSSQLKFTFEMEEESVWTLSKAFRFPIHLYVNPLSGVS